MAGSGRRVASQVQPSQQPDEVTPPREVRAARETFEDPQGKLREQVLAEKGLKPGDLLRLTGQARIQAEIAIASEVARRAGPPRLLDIRV